MCSEFQSVSVKLMRFFSLKLETLKISFQFEWWCALFHNYSNQKLSNQISDSFLFYIFYTILVDWNCMIDCIATIRTRLSPFIWSNLIKPLLCFIFHSSGELRISMPWGKEDVKIFFSWWTWKMSAHFFGDHPKTVRWHKKHNHRRPQIAEALRRTPQIYYDNPPLFHSYSNFIRGQISTERLTLTDKCWKVIKRFSVVIQLLNFG